jgi:hypothetical protein
MLDGLFALHRAGLVNREDPRYLFPEALIFNEGWLLRLVLKEWLAGAGGSGFVFLPFPEGVNAYSEGRLYTPFTALCRADKLAESYGDSVIFQQVLTMFERYARESGAGLWGACGQKWVKSGQSCAAPNN